LSRADVAVCVVRAGSGTGAGAGSGTGAGAGTGEQLRSHTPPGVPILEVGSETEAFERAAPADVVLLRPGCRVAPGWLEALHDAAYASATTATATALTQHDLHETPTEPFPQAAVQVQAACLRLRPRIESPEDVACMYVRRSALDLVDGQGTDFRIRCVELGLAHVLADDVLVLDPRPAQAGATAEPSPPVRRARAAARRALRGLSATIDASILSGPTTGTHVHVLELIAGLARTEQVRLAAILPDQPSQHALTRLRGLPRVDLVTYREAAELAAAADIVHRPFQLSNAGDLNFLRSLGERLLVTQQDLIAYHNPAYFPSPAAWQEYRELTRLGLRAADGVLFFSAHARDDALGEELVEPARAAVVHLGVDHPVTSIEPAAPAGAERLSAAPVLLCLGTDYLHKNRVFALRLLHALSERGVDARLVLAGPRVAHGSSRPQEERFGQSHPHLARAILDLGPVTEAEKRWLYARASLVVYPSVLEGFGLVPFEASAHGVPCLWAPGSALSELLPDEAAGIVPWHAAPSAENARVLLEDQSERERNLSAIDTAARSLTWDATAEKLLEVYRAAADAPARPRAAAGLTLTEDAARLVGPGGELPADVHRPLLALATHPRLARPAFAALKLGYRLLQRRR
jgi:glycosyltransferase involved in cell wall biosynthesis